MSSIARSVAGRGSEESYQAKEAEKSPVAFVAIVVVGFFYFASVTEALLGLGGDIGNLGQRPATSGSQENLPASIDRRRSALGHKAPLMGWPGATPRRSDAFTASLQAQNS